MVRRAALFLLLFVSASATLGQATATDSQTLQAMLAEIHQLRQDLETSAIAARRAQILIYRLHIQQAVVAQVTQRLDAAKLDVERLRSQQRSDESQLKQYEDSKENAQNDRDRNLFEGWSANIKSQLEVLASSEPEAEAAQMGLEQQARIEQAKLNRLENELDELDRAVMTAALHQDSSQRSNAKPQ